jgi:hypothetical protein
MDLSVTAPANELAAEFIHRQIDHPVEHWKAAGSRCARIENPTGGNLERQRAAHIERLQGGYSAAHVLNWMPSAT